MIGEILALASLLSGFGIYQIGVNKECDRRLDNLRIELNDISNELHKHVMISAANQEALEVRINANTALMAANTEIMNIQLWAIDEKLNKLTDTIKTFMEK